MRGGGGGGMGGGGGGMGGGGSTTIVDPPVGGPFADPPRAPNLSSETGVVEVSIAARTATLPLNGTNARLLTYNGSFVAPTIRAKRGDLVRMRFKNDLPFTTATNILGHRKNVTNMHVHGWHVTPGDNMDRMPVTPADNVHVAIPAGGGTLVGLPSTMGGMPYESEYYEYDLSTQRASTLSLYHPHVHGTVAEQFWGGLVGALEVEDEPGSPLGEIESHVVVLKDITLSAGEPAPYTSMMDYMHGKEGTLCTVNGQVNPALGIRPGEVKRLKILNASNARIYRLSLQGHQLQVIGTDGGLLGVPYPTSEILLASGERVDVLVKASATKGSYKLLALPYARQGNMTSPQITLMTIQVRNDASASSRVVPAVLDANAVYLDRDWSMIPADRVVNFTLSMGQGRGYINGISFDVMADGTVHATERHSMVGTEEIWRIVNNSGMDHPWHQHVNDGQVLDISGSGTAVQQYAQLMTGTPAWKDTIIVPKWGSVTLRLPIRDFGGMTMFHCHILEHEDIGMMGMWHIMDEGMPPMEM
jgi:FtsP/CotA-like multicopper oxidase with cupredoxin domain